MLLLRVTKLAVLEKDLTIYQITISLWFLLLFLNFTLLSFHSSIATSATGVHTGSIGWSFALIGTCRYKQVLKSITEAAIRLTRDCRFSIVRGWLSCAGSAIFATRSRLLCDDTAVGTRQILQEHHHFLSESLLIILFFLTVMMVAAQAWWGLLVISQTRLTIKFYLCFLAEIGFNGDEWVVELV